MIKMSWPEIVFCCFIGLVILSMLRVGLVLWLKRRSQ